MLEIAKLQVRVPATMLEKFTWLKAILRDTDLSASAKNVATALMMFHNDRSGQCNPSQRRLAEAVGLSRIRVNRLVAELKAGGWIEADGTLGASNYRLTLSRATGAIEAGECVEAEATLVLDLKHPCIRSETGGTSDLKHCCIESETQNHTGNDPEEPQRGTTQLTTAPDMIAIEPEMVGPARANANMPDQPKANLPRPANGDGAGLGVVQISGLEIPGEMYAEWEATFLDLDLRPAVMSRAKWAAGLSEKRKGHRFQALQTELGKMNAKERKDALGRKEAKAADAAAGIERDFHGRVIGAPKKSRFQW